VLALSKSILLAALLALTLCAADQAGLDQAEKLYQEGKWEQARQAYKAELDLVKEPGALPAAFFFNYGTILAKAGAPGEAYVMLLRASFARPFDGDVRHNLRKVEATVPASVRSIRPALWLSWWPEGLRFFPWTAWLVAGLACSALAFWLAPRAEPALWVPFAGLAALILLTAGLAYAQARAPTYGATAVTKVKSGPASSFTDIATIEPGTLVSQEEHRSGWHKIRFRRGGVETIGWAEASALLELR